MGLQTGASKFVAAAKQAVGKPHGNEERAAQLLRELRNVPILTPYNHVVDVFLPRVHALARQGGETNEAQRAAAYMVDVFKQNEQWGFTREKLQEALKPGMITRDNQAQKLDGMLGDLLRKYGAQRHYPASTNNVTDPDLAARWARMDKAFFQAALAILRPRAKMTPEYDVPYKIAVSLAKRSGHATALDYLRSFSDTQSRKADQDANHIQALRKKLNQ
jgi:hypothetical protein